MAGNFFDIAPKQIANTPVPTILNIALDLLLARRDLI